MTLRRQFILVLATFSVALAAAFGFLSWRLASEALETELNRRLVQVPGALVAGGVLGSNVADLRPGDESLRVWSAARSRLDSLRSSYVADAFVFDSRDLTVLVTADSVPIGDTLRFLSGYGPDIREALLEGSATTPSFDLFGEPYKYGFVRIGETPAVVGVRIPADFNQPLESLQRVLLWGTLVGVAVAIVLGGVLAGKIVEPIERLSRVALRIQRGHMDREVRVEPGNEIGRLSRAMERMRQGIVERDEQLRLMLAQVAHEIRNPLGGLELFASAASETEDAAERARLMDRVRGEVRALNRIIDDFLTFARPLTAQRDTIDLRAPLRDAAELAAGEAERMGKVLEIHTPDEPLLAAVDRDRIKRAVLNLLRNASQAADRRVVATASRHGSEVVLSVADDGPGVPEDQRERVFEPFVTDKEQGAGLGLSIVRKVVEAHDGRVEVGRAEAPELGSGAEFRIYLPGLEEPPPDARPGPRSP